MKAKELIAKLNSGALSAYSHLYRDIPTQTERFLRAIKAGSFKWCNDCWYGAKVSKY